MPLKRQAPFSEQRSSKKPKPRRKPAGQQSPAASSQSRPCVRYGFTVTSVAQLEPDEWFRPTTLGNVVRNGISVPARLRQFCGYEVLKGINLRYPFSRYLLSMPGYATKTIETRTHTGLCNTLPGNCVAIIETPGAAGVGTAFGRKLAKKNVIPAVIGYVKFADQVITYTDNDVWRASFPDHLVESSLDPKCESPTLRQVELDLTLRSEHSEFFSRFEMRNDAWMAK